MGNVRRCLLAVAALAAFAWAQDIKNLPSGGPPMELSFQVGHANWPYGFDVASDGRRFATASANRVIVWERPTEVETHVFDEPGGGNREVEPVRFSPDGRYLFMFGTSVWDLATQHESARLPSHRCISAVWSPDGRLLLTGSKGREAADGARALLWDATTGELLEVLDLPGRDTVGVDWSADGKYLLTASGDASILWGAHDHSQSVVIWDARTVERVTKFSDPLDGAIFHPDSLRVLTWRDTVAELRGIPHGKVVQRFGFYWPKGSAKRVDDPEPAKVYDIKPPTYKMEPSFSPDGRLLAMYHGEKLEQVQSVGARVAIWDVKTRELLRTMLCGNGMQEAMFTPDGRELVILSPPQAGTNSLMFWDTESWERRRMWPRKELLLDMVAGFRSDGELYVASMDPLLLWNLERGEARISIPNATRLSPDGRFGIETTHKGVVLYDVETGREARRFESDVLLWFAEARFSSDNRHLVLSGHRYTEKKEEGYRWPSPVYDEYEAAVWDVETGEAVRTFRLGEDYLGSAELCLGGTALLTIAEGRNQILLDVATGKEIRRFGTPQSQAEREAAERTRPDGSMEATTFTPDSLVDPTGRILLSGCYWKADGRKPDRRGDRKKLEGDHFEGFSTIAWDLRTGRELGEFPDERPAAFSPDGRWAAMTRAEELVVRETGSFREALVLKGADFSGFSSDGGLLVTGDESTVVLWSLETFDPVRTFEVGKTFSASVWGGGHAELSPDGRRLLVLKDPGQAMVWDVESGRRLATLVTMVGGPEWLVVTPQGYYHGTDAAFRVVGWRIEGAVFPVDLYHQRFHRPDLVAKALRGEDLPAEGSISGAHTPPDLTVEIEATKHDHVRFRAVARPGSKGAAITALRVYVDGRDIPPERREEVVREKEGDQVVFRGRIDFPPGKTKAVVAAVATDEYGLQSRPALEVIVRPGPATPVARKLYVLTVGVSKYADSSNDLWYPASGAERLAAELRKQEGLAFHEVETKVLTNERATRAGIEAGLRWLRESCGPTDVAILHFSGHGMRDYEGRLYYVPYDADAEALEATFLAWDGVARGLRDVRAAQILFLSDCCRAGAFGKRAVSQEDLARTLLTEARVMVFASSRGNEVSYEMSNIEGSAFMHAVLLGLSGEADLIEDGRITVSELQTYVADQVKKLTWDRQHPHIPRMNDFDPELVLAHVE